MRLIDADELIEQMEADAEHMDDFIAQMMLYASISDVKHAPTIELTQGGDLISRQEAIDALTEENLFKHMDTVNDGGQENRSAIRIIKSLPSAQPERKGEWIPCSERLPEDEQLVLFSTKTGRVHQGKCHKDGSVNQWYSALDKMRAWNNVVTAWMPLPEPYKEEEEHE